MSDQQKGMKRGLTRYGDEAFSLYLRKAFIKAMGYSDDALARPVIGIANTYSDYNACHANVPKLVEAVKRGVMLAGGLPMEFPTISLHEAFAFPTSMYFRNLMAMDTEEMIRAQPMDSVVLMGGCDKTTPALLMAAATVNIPAIALSVGPMLNGWFQGERTGSGTIVWKAREMLAAGEIDDDGFMELVASSAPSVGYCNTMGTATTMNSLAEALGMQLAGAAAIPAPYRERGQISYETGRRIVDMVWEDLRPSDIMTRAAFENAIVINSAIGGSTNAPIHLNGIARHLGVELNNDDWQAVGHHVPLMVNLQPAGEYLGEDYHRAGGVPAVAGELLAAGLLPHPDALTVNGRSMGDNCNERRSENPEVIKSADRPILANAGFINLSGNLFDSAIMKVIAVALKRHHATHIDIPQIHRRTAVNNPVGKNFACTTR